MDVNTVTDVDTLTLCVYVCSDSVSVAVSYARSL